MKDAPVLPPDDPKARAAHYRARAEEVRKRAPSIRAAGLISSFLQIAETYDRLALTEETAGETTEPDASDKPRS